jgi:hypothetical protein
MELAVSRRVIVSNLYVDTLFGRDLFDSILERYGKDAWNAFSDRLRRDDIWAMYSTPEPRNEEDTCMPVCLHMDLSHGDFRGSDLAGLDLLVPDFTSAQFCHAKMAGCRIGTVDHASFLGADLRGADFEMATISGSDFTEACLDEARFEHCRYLRSAPPVGLPDAVLRRCSPFPADWDHTPDPTEAEVRIPLRVEAACLKSFWGSAD